MCLSLTLEQQFFVLAEYLGNASGRLCARSDPQRGGCSYGGCAAAVAADVWRVAGVRDAAGWRRRAGGPPAGGGRCVCGGLSAGDAGAIARHVASHGGVRVFVVFLEFALLHAEFVAAFRDGAGADRVVLRRACRTGTTGVQRRTPPGSLLLLCRGRKTGRRCH
ncbi:putative receptor-type adenylate cyclase [Trypanosoma cruzi]|uniref:Putative receptor-type adenylate cyclase n=1 Tax=Trypanosoma cruzi TaxID=5693 RepID=A0A2V2V8Y8_TRYCR|nr:putative receptor-type adenylate cyclase [Trypanosoma cruzi]